MNRQYKAIMIEDWPPDERARWRNAVAKNVELFGETGAGAHWAEATRTQVASGYGLWLGYVNRNGALHGARMPCDRLTGDLLAGFVQELINRVAPVTVVSRLRDISEALRIMQPHGDRTLLIRVMQRLGISARPSRDKRARLIAPSELYEAGIARMEAAEKAKSRGEIIKALHFSDGLRIAMLIAKPVRLRNLVATQIGTHLVKSGHVYRWRFGANETKTAEVIDALLPGRLTPYIERWIVHHRQRLLGDGTSEAMWISIKGQSMGRAAVYERICKATEEETGRRITPHAFRDIVATGIAIATPEDVRMTPFLLDHRSDRTVQEHYNLADSLSASDRYLDRLEERRQSALASITRR